MDPQKTNDTQLAASVALITSASLSVLVMLHHPTSHSHGQSTLNALVHGAMLILLATMYFGFASFAFRNSITRSSILCGFIAYSIHVGAHFIAATMNGFIVPSLAHRETALGHDVFVLCHQTNQSSAALGIFAAGAAFCFWGYDYLTRGGLKNQIIGSLGLLCGLVPLGVMTYSGFGLDVRTAIVVYGIHALWTLVVGIDLLKRNELPETIIAES